MTVNEILPPGIRRLKCGSYNAQVRINYDRLSKTNKKLEVVVDWLESKKKDPGFRTPAPAARVPSPTKTATERKYYDFQKDVDNLAEMFYLQSNEMSDELFWSVYNRIVDIYRTHDQRLRYKQILNRKREDNGRTRSIPAGRTTEESISRSYSSSEENSENIEEG
jgi:hypothetical protein